MNGGYISKSTGSASDRSELQRTARCGGIEDTEILTEQTKLRTEDEDAQPSQAQLEGGFPI